MVCQALEAHSSAEGSKVVKQAKEPLRIATESVTDLQPQQQGEEAGQVGRGLPTQEVPPHVCVYTHVHV